MPFGPGVMTSMKLNSIWVSLPSKVFAESEATMVTVYPFLNEHLINEMFNTKITYSFLRKKIFRHLEDYNSTNVTDICKIPFDFRLNINS